MAETTQFNHDRLSHLLSERLLRVPHFQRSYSWDATNVAEFLNDLKSARKRDSPYFMGTVVFARSAEDGQRQQIVDGQQRLATTAILLIAVRDLLTDYKKGDLAKHLDDVFLRSYDLESEETVERLILNPEDQPFYDALLARTPVSPGQSSLILDCYKACIDYLRGLAPTAADYKDLVALTKQLEDEVQVLVAVASDLSEAYVIFETLNDRGADLTTADLLKNYLFSQAKQNFDYVQNTWVVLGAAFDKPDDMVKFIRYEYASRNGRVTTRGLYKAIQEDIGTGQAKAKKYLRRLDDARAVYAAIRDPDNERWNRLDVDVRDALLAYRRFGFESSMPLLIAAFENWEDERAAKLLNQVAAWSVRALFVGRIGASLSEEAFGEAARAVSSAKAKKQEDVRVALARLLPSNGEFELAFAQFGTIPVSRAKYLLAMLERARRHELGQTVDNMPDWSSKGVAIERVHDGQTEGSEPLTLLEQLGNLTLLERTLARDLAEKRFEDKKAYYLNSNFILTNEVAAAASWQVADVAARTQGLAKLASSAWPL